MSLTSGTGTLKSKRSIRSISPGLPLPIFSPARDGFNFLPPSSDNLAKDSKEMSRQDEIPLQQVVSHGSAFRTGTGSSATARNEQEAFAEKTPMASEKTGLFHRHTRGRRRLMKMDSKGKPIGRKGDDGEEDTITWMGRVYDKFTGFSIITRYFVYVLPVGLAIAIPIIVGATAAKDAMIGDVRIVWLFTWIEIVWLSLWVAKVFTHFLPGIFQFFAGVVSSGTRKYALILKALALPITIALWALTSLATFSPLMTHNPDTQRAADIQSATGQPRTADELKQWQNIVREILAAALVSSLIFLAEKVVVQLISINYHRKQFNGKIQQSKRNVYLLGLLYDASRALFPMFCNEFAEEDYAMTDSLELDIPGFKAGSHQRSGSQTPIRLLQDVGRFGDKITSVFGNVAHELTGKQILNPNAAHSIVVEALERNRSAEALAKRLWMSFVVEGREALYPEDIREVLGAGKKDEAEEAFGALDRDGNGDISLDEMILMVTEIGRERKSIASSMHDVDQAIKVLDGLLATVVFVICIFVLVAFLNHSFVTTLATAGTALLSLSFVFAATAQEFLGSCIFLFVKHPFDIGDRVDITDTHLTVEHISLLFTVFKRVTDGKMVQIPNIVLNSLWIENVTRSKAMREQISMFVHFDTSFEDIKALRQEMQNFVTDRENSRDFQPEIEVEVVGIAEMNKLELRVEIRHKSNWHNETVRAARRSKFMCALVLALRKVPIYAPGGGDAALGDIGKPTYSVAVSHEQAQAEKDKFAAAKEAKRLNPTPKPSTPPNQQFPSGETKAMDALNTRPPHSDFARDEAYNSREQNENSDSSNTLTDTTAPRTSSDQQLDELRGVLRAESTRGKRRAGDSGMSPPPSQGLSTVGEGSGYASPLARNPPSASPAGGYSPYQASQGMTAIPPPPGGPYQGRPGTGGSQGTGNGSGRQGPVYKPSGSYRP